MDSWITRLRLLWNYINYIHHKWNYSYYFIFHATVNIQYKLHKWNMNGIFMEDLHGIIRWNSIHHDLRMGR